MALRDPECARPLAPASRCAIRARLAVFGPLVACRLLVACGLVACKLGADVIELPPLTDQPASTSAPSLLCKSETTTGCENNVFVTCERAGEFLQSNREDCNIGGRICSPVRGCSLCAPGSVRCQPCGIGDTSCDTNVVQRCDQDGAAWEDIDRCDLSLGFACNQGVCRKPCDVATENRSYVGCEFYAADLDNAAIDDLNNAAAQQFAVAVANPQAIAVDVSIEINEAPVGQPARPVLVTKARVPPGALEVFKLPQRELDGSSDGRLNDGTHTALSSNAFRVSSSFPVSAYQFNPLENVNVFSNDSSLLLPTSAIGARYTVVSWPQTIGDSDNPDQDFDSTSSDEDLRAFLTIIGTAEGTQLTVTMGNKVMKVVGGGPIRELQAGDVLELTLNPFDVLNLETAGLNADFTGTSIQSSHPVTVFVGSEASDAPIFGTYATRQCCADHLEEQLIPDSTLGNRFIIARTPSRTEALAAAAAPGETLGVQPLNEPEWVRVLAVGPGVTHITTTLPGADARFELQPGEDRILKADQDFLLESEDRPISVLQVMGSQGVTGIPRQYPGGDPSIIVVPPIEQYRRDYIFLTPDKYAFDFVTIMADAAANILLDGEPLPATCQTSPADGIARSDQAPPVDWVVHRCQLSFPIVTSGLNSTVLPGEQHDGVHTILSDMPVGIIVDGFDRFVSHAYPGGLNLDILN